MVLLNTYFSTKELKFKESWLNTYWVYCQNYKTKQVQLVIKFRIRSFVQHNQSTGAHSQVHLQLKGKLKSCVVNKTGKNPWKTGCTSFSVFLLLNSANSFASRGPALSKQIFIHTKNILWILIGQNNKLFLSKKQIWNCQ